MAIAKVGGVGRRCPGNHMAARHRQPGLIHIGPLVAAAVGELRRVRCAFGAARWCVSRCGLVRAACLVGMRVGLDDA